MLAKAVAAKDQALDAANRKAASLLDRIEGLNARFALERSEFEATHRRTIEELQNERAERSLAHGALDIARKSRAALLAQYTALKRRAGAPEPRARRRRRARRRARPADSNVMAFAPPERGRVTADRPPGDPSHGSRDAEPDRRRRADRPRRRPGAGPVGPRGGVLVLDEGQAAPERRRGRGAGKRDWSSALDLVSEAFEAIRMADERAAASEEYQAELVQRHADHVKVLETRIAAAEKRADAAENRAKAAEGWLSKFHDTIIDEFQRTFASRGGAR